MSTITEQTPDLAALADQVAEAQAEVDRLVAEQAALAAQRRAAAERADSAALVALQGRGDVLPVAVNAARARVIRLRILQIEASIPDLDRERVRLAEAAHRAREAADEARRKADAAGNAAAGAGEAVRTARQDVADLRRELDRLISEQSKVRGPIVRSAWQWPSGG